MTTQAIFKFDKWSQKIIANFSRINPAIMFRPGNEIITVGKDKDIFGVARLDGVSIPTTFAITDLSKFLNVLKQFGDEPDLLVDGDGRTLVINPGGTPQIKYTLASEKVIEANLCLREDWKPPVINVGSSFKLPANDLLYIKKAMSVGQLTEVVFVADGETLIVEGFRASDPTSDEFSMKLCDIDATFNLTFIDRKIKAMLDGDYDVFVGTTTEREIPIIRCMTDGLEYFVTPEVGSGLHQRTKTPKGMTNLNYTLDTKEIATLRRLLEGVIDQHYNGGTSPNKNFVELCSDFGIPAAAFEPIPDDPFTPAAHWRKQPIPNFITIQESHILLLCKILEPNLSQRSIYQKLVELQTFPPETAAEIKKIKEDMDAAIDKIKSKGNAAINKIKRDCREASLSG
jgi:hypothetical protein